jgi:hypothetical protein
MEPSKQPINAEIKLSKKRLALAFAIAGISDAVGAFATPLPPIVWVVDLATVLTAVHGAGSAMAAVAGTSSGGDSGPSILAAGGWSDCCPRHSSADV